MRIMYAGHMDEIGFIVHYIDADDVPGSTPLKAVTRASIKRAWLCSPLLIGHEVGVLLSKVFGDRQTQDYPALSAPRSARMSAGVSKSCRAVPRADFTP